MRKKNSSRIALISNECKREKSLSSTIRPWQIPGFLNGINRLSNGAMIPTIFNNREVRSQWCFSMQDEAARKFLSSTLARLNLYTLKLKTLPLTISMQSLHLKLMRMRSERFGRCTAMLQWIEPTGMLSSPDRKVRNS